MKPDLFDADIYEQKETSKGKRIGSYVSTALLAAVLIFVTVLVVSVFIQTGRGEQPSVFGYRVLYIKTDSMTPSIQVGDVILSKTLSKDEVLENVKVGDVITYTAAYGNIKGMSITHRVIEEAHYDEEYGRMVVTTQGTKENAAIDPPVPVENVESVMVRKSVLISGSYKVFRNPAGLICLIIVPGTLMIVFFVLQMVLSLKPKKVKARTLTAEELKKKAAIEAAIKKQVIEEYIKAEALRKAEQEKNKND